MVNAKIRYDLCGIRHTDLCVTKGDAFSLLGVPDDVKNLDVIAKIEFVVEKDGEELFKKEMTRSNNNYVVQVTNDENTFTGDNNYYIRKEYTDGTYDTQENGSWLKITE